MRCEIFLLQNGALYAIKGAMATPSTAPLTTTKRTPLMKTLEYTTVDKTTWGPGPWQTEPDKRQWQDPTTGLPCLIVRGPLGALCGYVGLTDSHPLFQHDYDDVNVDVHGGLTYANFCQPTEENHGICHLPDEGESDHVWWFGFDCAHLWDLTPGSQYFKPDDAEYRTIDYVTSEVTRLAAQLADLTKWTPLHASPSW